MAAVLHKRTRTVALVPASLGSAWGFRRETTNSAFAPMAAPAEFVGGAIGAWLVVLSPINFADLVPWLILTAAIFFRFSRL